MSNGNCLLDYKFLVGDKPYCFWGLNLKEMNKQFLQSLDPSYFEYIVNTAKKELEGNYKMQAAIQIRNAYYQSMEAFFSLLGATIQAPQLPSAWIMKCSNNELREIIMQIQKGTNKIKNRLSLDYISFDNLSNKIHSPIESGNKDKDNLTQALFSRLWHTIASDFLNQDYIDEYNSIKHGLRLKSGGFYIGLGLQKEPGVPSLQEELQYSGFNFGSSFLRAKKVGKKLNGKNAFHYSLNQQSLNWIPESTAEKTLLCCISTKNVLSFLKIIAGEKEGIEYFRPKNDEQFTKPWLMACSPMSFSIGEQIKDEWVEDYTFQDIERAYEI